MKNRIQFYVIIACTLTSSSLFGQTVTKTSASPVSGTVCPQVATFYEVSVPSGFGGCTINWSATNGQATKDQSDQRKAKVVWSDAPGATGTVTATFSNCGTANEGNNGQTASKSELILSVKGQSWGSYTNVINNINYCIPAPVSIIVPRMFVPGTGGIAQPPLQEVRYAWTLPTGWQTQTGATGQVNTGVNSITILPTKCALPGIVKVEGVIVDRCGSAGLSAPATITLNVPPANVIVVPQAGYTGGSACNTTPVTFYANPNVGCASAYSWSWPPSWTEVTRSGNSITLRPSGNQNDVGDIKATVTFSCGSSITSVYKPPFNNPTISSPYDICYGGTTVTVTNVGNQSVTWQPSSNMTVVSGQGTSSAVIRALNSSTSGIGYINASIPNCNVTVPQKNVWVGVPSFSNFEINTFPFSYMPDYDFLVCPYSNVTLRPVTTYNQEVLQHEWTVSGSYTILGSTSVQPLYFHTAGYYPASVFANYRFRNVCGWSAQKQVRTFNMDCDSGAEPEFTYPNPTSDQLTVSTNQNQEGETSLIILTDSKGNIVLKESTTYSQLIISVKDFEPGIYQLRLKNKQGTKNKRIIIEK